MTLSHEGSPGSFVNDSTSFNDFSFIPYNFLGLNLNLDFNLDTVNNLEKNLSINQTNIFTNVKFVQH